MFLLQPSANPQERELIFTFFVVVVVPRAVKNFWLSTADLSYCRLSPLWLCPFPHRRAFTLAFLFFSKLHLSSVFPASPAFQHALLSLYANMFIWMCLSTCPSQLVLAHGLHSMLSEIYSVSTLTHQILPVILYKLFRKWKLCKISR